MPRRGGARNARYAPQVKRLAAVPVTMAAVLLAATCGQAAKTSAPKAPASTPPASTPATTTTPGAPATRVVTADVQKAEVAIKAALTQAQPALEKASKTGGTQQKYQFVAVAEALTQAAGDIVGIEAGADAADATTFANTVGALQSDFNQATVNLSQASKDLAAYGTAANHYNQDLGI